VAGVFYPEDPAELSGTIDSLLAAAQPQELDGELRALICPHAGYSFSGPVAASAYRQLEGRDYSTVVLLGVSHFAPFPGASIASADLYRTPLGDVPVAALAGVLSKQRPFVPEPRCRAERPPWVGRASSERASAEEGVTAESLEHSGEVQVPFLQKTLGKFALVPVLTGQQLDPEEAARVLASHLDASTLVVASSDLSHYHPYEKARELDTRCAQAICNLDVESMNSQQACGRTGVLVVMHLAKQLGWKAKLLDYRNSGDTGGDKAAVVGYSAIAFYAPRAGTPTAAYSAQERAQLLESARRELETSAGGAPGNEAEEASSPMPDNAKFSLKKGCFVTLTCKGRLRGCIGSIMPREPLWSAVVHHTRNAALRDPRFPPVRREEVDGLTIEISVLTVPEPVAFDFPEELLGKLRPHRDGVVLRMGAREATYLPQVWERLPEKAAFLNSLAEKAGASPADWRKPGAEVRVYQVESFSEPER
jgi:AmmeMemoRadiSam system protein A